MRLLEVLTSWRALPNCYAMLNITLENLTGREINHSVKTVNAENT